jgi:hypothetical protein
MSCLARTKALADPRCDVGIGGIDHADDALARTSDASI